MMDENCFNCGVKKCSQRSIKATFGLCGDGIPSEYLGTRNVVENQGKVIREIQSLISKDLELATLYLNDPVLYASCQYIFNSKENLSIQDALVEIIKILTRLRKELFDDFVSCRQRCGLTIPIEGLRREGKPMG